MKDIYAALDIGSATIKLLVGETVSSNINVLFSKKIISHGIVKGKIEKMSAVVEDIKQLLAEAADVLGAPITSVALCIPSLYARIYQSDGITKVNSVDDRITNDDIIRALKLSKRFDRSSEEEIVSVIPINYYLDTKVINKSPIGMKSASLKVESLIITTKKDYFYDYILAVEKAGLEVLEVTINSFACAKEAFDEVYLQEGAILIDIGFKSSTIAFFEDGYLKYIAQAPVGGYDLTKKIAASWKIVLDKAEVYKVKYGTCDVEIGDEDIIHTTKLKDEEVKYTQKDLAIELEAGVREIMEVIKTKIDVINDGRNYETIIVGGGGELPMLDKVASEVLGCVVRSYRPETIGTRDMVFVSCLGMMYYMNDRNYILGKIEPSVVLSDISNTMGVRFKGLTKTKSNDDKSGGKFSRFLENIFSED
jgi:cell division protein FtsA